MRTSTTRAGRFASKATTACLIVAVAAGCAAARGPAELGTSLAAASSESDWSRVRQLAPGAEIVITIQGTSSRTRYFVAADESTLLALNGGAPGLPADASRTLREMAAENPEQLVALHKGGSLVRGSVRIGRDGAFVDDRRIAAFDEVLETTPRGRVSQIEGPVVARGSVAGALIGAWLGFSVGVVPALGGASEGVAWVLLAGSVAVGGYLGNHWSRHTTDGVVYRAP